MIYKRFAANLRAQNWFAIGIELGIVVLGVFLGTWVATWNQQRMERAEAQYRLEQLKPELDRLRARTQLVQDYYATTRSYAQTAFAAWRSDPKVNDNAFVIAAYQASQIRAMSSSAESWATIVGADQLRNIDNPEIREPLVRLVTFPEENLGLARMQTKYRESVRTIIPDDIQQAIRSKCGDYFATPASFDYSLPVQCPLILDPTAAAATAAELRAHPELVGLLQLHLAMTSSLLNDVRVYESAARRLSAELDR